MEPYCSTINEENCLFTSQCKYFSIYNTISTVCNCLRIIILLNKYQDDTSFVFFINACMICVYVDSNVVAVHYFALNSHDKLTDAGVTAQSCLAISLYLRVKKNQNSLVALRIRNFIQERLKFRARQSDSIALTKGNNSKLDKHKLPCDTIPQTQHHGFFPDMCKKPLLVFLC